MSRHQLLTSSAHASKRVQFDTLFNSILILKSLNGFFHEADELVCKVENTQSWLVILCPVPISKFIPVQQMVVFRRVGRGDLCMDEYILL
jgi:hypothetical protein